MIISSGDTKFQLFQGNPSAGALSTGVRKDLQISANISVMEAVLDRPMVTRGPLTGSHRAPIIFRPIFVRTLVPFRTISPTTTNDRRVGRGVFLGRQPRVCIARFVSDN